MTTSTSTTRMPDDTVNAVTDSRWPNLRSRMVQDLHDDRPEDDGAMPIIELRHSIRKGWRAEILDLTAGSGVHWPEYESALAAAERFGGDFERLERYLKIFHGCTGTDYMSDRDGGVYIACDPAVWREEVGAEEGADLGEWRDYLNGEVYTILVEKLVEWDEVGGDRKMQTWDVQDSLSGLFGWSYALVTCGDMLREAGAELDADGVMRTVLA